MSAAAVVVTFGLLIGGLCACLLPSGRGATATSRSRGVRALRGVFGGVLSTALVVVPSAIFVRASLGESSHQIAVPPAARAPLPSRAIGAFRASRARCLS